MDEIRLKTENENQTAVIRWKNNGFQFLLETKETESFAETGSETNQSITRKLLHEIKNE